jgi:hypothetical protein
MNTRRSPEIYDVILAEWPGESELQEFVISDIRPDRDGVECAIFGKDGIVGAEAIDDLQLVDGTWVTK